MPILNGWISPEGEIFSCGLMEHKDLAQDISEQKGFDMCYAEEYDTMWQNGYIRFSGNPNCPDPIITFDETHFVRKLGYVPEITEAQKMAQARLIKQLRSEEA